MCGIGGVISRSEETRASARQIASVLHHRGPDGSGYWSEGPVALVHRRLSILDLSTLGAQPMESHSRRSSIVFNGEIYNFQEIRSELEAKGISFKSNCDTEVLIEAYEEFGLSEALKRFNGMFAFAIWDKQTQALSLARDRLGEKPLYYGWHNQDFLFSSELGGLLALKNRSFEIDQTTASLLFRHNYIPAPHSALKGIYKLSPGTYLQLGINELLEKPTDFSRWYDSGSHSPRKYWKAPYSQSGLTAQRDPVETEQELSSLLDNAVAKRMIADVPLGAFLSGGIDSSLVVSRMQKLSTRPVKTFTIGFEETGFNEAVYAKQVAAHLGTDHHELYVQACDALKIVPNLAQMYSEPFSDSSQIPTFLVSQLARDNVTVALSGDGGDELFYGYPRYPIVHSLAKMFLPWPKALRTLISSMILAVPAQAYSALSPLQGLFLAKPNQVTNVGRRVHQLARSLKTESANSLYLQAITHWHTSHNLHPSLICAETELERAMAQSSGLPLDERMSQFDIISYLPDDILTKVDIATMAVSLEARVPLLDHRLVEFACTLPISIRCKGNEQKGMLKSLLAQMVPKKLFERPKMGFGIPLHSWLRRELRDWAEDLLDKRVLEEQGLLNSVVVHKIWQEHLTGKYDWHYMLWDILMFQAWRKQYRL